MHQKQNKNKNCILHKMQSSGATAQTPWVYQIQKNQDGNVT